MSGTTRPSTQQNPEIHRMIQGIFVTLDSNNQQDVISGLERITNLAKRIPHNQQAKTNLQDVQNSAILLSKTTSAHIQHKTNYLLKSPSVEKLFTLESND